MARSFAVLIVLLWLTPPAMASAPTPKLDATLTARAHAPAGISRVIVTTVDGRPADATIRSAGGTAGRRLAGGRSQVALMADSALSRLAADPRVASVSIDRPVTGAMDRTAAAVGAAWVRDSLGFDGTGVGVAVIDSGVANWHDDLPEGRIVHFADFVTNLPVPHDGYGHGTHVAGVIAGSGYDSGGTRRGIAPGASLVVLKVLDEAGDGHISDVIAAIDHAIEQRARFNIRVINLSVAAGVYESYRTDPLALAARRATDAGIVVVTAAGNHGRSARGQLQYGGVTSPGNAPWVLTVGASNHQKTTSRADDAVAAFSSRGPTLIDRAMKPDVVAPGVGIESLGAPGSTLYLRHPEARITGTIDTAAAPYLSLTGTSMAAPVVAGTVALMIEANPSLTPNLVKAILHYTAERRARVDTTAQGAGFVNTRGAVQLAAALAGRGEAISDPTGWSRQIVWGNRRIQGGVITADGTAWREDVSWGESTTPDGESVTWGRSANGDERWGARRAGGSGLEPEPDLHEYDTDGVQAAWAADAARQEVWGSSEPAGQASSRPGPPAMTPVERRRRGNPVP